MVGDLVPQRALDLGPQKFRIAPEVALDRVLVEDDPVLAIPVHDRAAVVVPVRAELGSVVGDHDRHRPEDVLELLRQAVMLYYYDDVSYRELGELLGVSAATINARLTKARTILRQRLGACRVV